MIRVCTIMRICFGVTVLRADTVAQEKAVANMSPSPMTREFISRLVTAREEQMPRICRNTALSLMRPE